MKFRFLMDYAQRFKACSLASTVALFCIGSTAAWAQSDIPPLTITTGGPNGTYYAFAEDIKQMLPRNTPFEIVESDGSIENLRRLLGYDIQNQNRHFQLALVQADVLEQLRERSRSNQILSDIVDRIKVVLPLYNEEVHVFTLTDNAATSLADIKERGLTVAAGDERSGHNMTARWLFDLQANVESPLDWSNGDYDDGLPGLGEDYDVAFYVAGAPSEFAQKIPTDKGVTLMPLDLPNVPGGRDSPYSSAVIERGTYPWLKEDVRTISVRALLVAFDYDEANPYCQQIADMTRRIVETYPSMVQAGVGHEKWADVDLTTAASRGDLYRCSEPVLNGR
ncbi:MAG: TAXI family TRAP transporter solute-binding subunit [Pseudomonadota bacterium]